MQHEYDSLRKELLEWQNRRVVLLTTSFTVVTGVLAIGQGFSERIPWWSVSLALLLFLSAACRLTAYAGYVNQRIGAFLQVFHDPLGTLRWESRSALCAKGSLGTDRSAPNLNDLLFWFYLLLGVVSVSLPGLLFKGVLPTKLGVALTSYGLDLIIVSAGSLLFLTSLLRLRRTRHSRAELVRMWRCVAESEQQVLASPAATSEGPVGQSQSPKSTIDVSVDRRSA